MHATRLSSLLDAVEALLIGKRLSLTYLARNLQNCIKERHSIRKVDRLLANKHLHKELKSCYKAHCIFLLGKIPRPVISIDWAATDKRKDWHILRATLNIEGRGLVYQEIHPNGKHNSRQVQNNFLDKLKSMLPPQCKPIIIADAGFQCPWFIKVAQIGFDFLGRVRTKTGYRLENDDKWHGNCLELYKIAKHKAKLIGRFILTKRWKVACNVVMCKKKKKGRKCINRSGNRTNNNASNRCAKRETDPWLLVTSLEINKILSPEKIVALYAKRMQIEEDFRDLKSHRYGFGLRYSMSNNAKRIEVLLLIAALACLACWLIALSAKKKNLHLDYQSNSIKTRNVLSITYLACQIVRKNTLITFDELKEAYIWLETLILEASLSC